ncbi:hypothetical protein HUT06_05820 [Actinomadura sp. NAK00032]|uniref:hypothetical protein n=1 Tax=Actinomadura sp. NAK00032 TaxID=2742128 RepID=UPI001592112B|nr:hypothetical protein [Actinomadura sp. NAK00032]QKW33606.1 hypothetical protein HUT06_05820 [Actinomadura sp. NAK00032]
MAGLAALAAVAAAVAVVLAARLWWRARWAGQAGVPRRAPGAKGAPELQVTLGPRAYRWPFALAVAGPAVGLLICATTLPNGDAWESGAVTGPLVFYGGGGLLVGLAGAVWALTVHRTRLIVTISGDGIALRRRDGEATIPSAAVRAVGLTWPISDPVWTTWYDPAAAPGVDAVTAVGRRGAQEAAATLLRDRSLPAGWVEAVHAATFEILGGGWRVLDDRDREVPAPPPRALFEADRVLVDGEGRYRNERGGALLAQACGPLAKRSTGGASFWGANPNKKRRSITLRDPHARTLLLVNRSSRTLGKERVTVLDAGGNRLGELSGRGEMSLRSAGGAPLGTVRRDGGRHVVLDTAGREAASLRTKSKADNSRMWLEFAPDCPEPLRPLVLALPIAVRLTRQV